MYWILTFYLFPLSRLRLILPSCRKAGKLVIFVFAQFDGESAIGAVGFAPF